jgi:hypothetical protein
MLEEIARSLPDASISVLSDGKRPRLRNFRFEKKDCDLVQKTIANDFGSKAMGFDLLSDQAYRMLAKAALRKIVKLQLINGISAISFSKPLLSADRSDEYSV